MMGDLSKAGLSASGHGRCPSTAHDMGAEGDFLFAEHGSTIVATALAEKPVDKTTMKAGCFLSATMSFK